jgi:hypothetical protein|tara:strand:- start:3878 stop:3979 length:102 start_codon:yes stop_codon:yes gene_type:complete
VHPYLIASFIGSLHHRHPDGQKPAGAKTGPVLQ